MKESTCFRLEGAPNFRDFGGYHTNNGGKILPGKLFRSDALDKLSDPDLSLMAESGPNHVIDLRGPIERTFRPHRLTDDFNPQIHSFPITGDLRTNDTSVTKLIVENPNRQGVYGRAERPVCRHNF